MKTAQFIAFNVKFRESDQRSPDCIALGNSVIVRGKHTTSNWWINVGIRGLVFGTFMALFRVGIAPLLLLGGVAEAPPRVDTVFLLDISGSMTGELRQELVTQRMVATGPPSYWLPDALTRRELADLLRRPTVHPFVESNLLFRSIGYLQTLVDDLGHGVVFFGAFDDGFQPWVRFENMPDKLKGVRVPKGVLGPFSLLGLQDQDSQAKDAALKLALKRMLAPEDNGLTPGGEDWRGFFLESVLRGRGPTALYDVCEAGCDLLLALQRQTGYKSAVAKQQLILLTDGLEEKNPKRPFSYTRNKLKLVGAAMPFDFRLIYLLHGGSLPPEVLRLGEELDQVAGAQLVILPRLRLDVANSTDAEQLSGTLAEERGRTEARVRLAPLVKFRVNTDGALPQGRLRFKVEGAAASGVAVDVSPGEFQLSEASAGREFTLTFTGDLGKIFDSKTEHLDGLRLSWSLSVDKRTLGGGGGASGLRSQEVKVVMLGRTSMPVSIVLVGTSCPITIRSVHPALPVLPTDGKIQIEGAPLSGEVAALEVDFGECRDQHSVTVEIRGVQPPDSLVLGGNPEGKMLLSGDKANPKARLSLGANGLSPGTGRASALLVFKAKEAKDIVGPVMIVDETVLFAPAPIPLTWLAGVNAKTNQPGRIDFGMVRMSAGPTGLPDVEEPPPVTTFRVDIPPKAVQPPLEWVLAGPNPEAFRVTRVEDRSVGGADNALLSGRIEFKIQAAHIYDPGLKRPETRQVSATLEIRTKANFVFDVQGERDATQAKVLSIPLQMNAQLQSPEQR